MTVHEIFGQWIFTNSFLLLDYVKTFCQEFLFLCWIITEVSIQMNVFRRKYFDLDHFNRLDAFPTYWFILGQFLLAFSCYIYTLNKTGSTHPRNTRNMARDDLGGK